MYELILETYHFLIDHQPTLKAALKNIPTRAISKDIYMEHLMSELRAYKKSKPLLEQGLLILMIVSTQEYFCAKLHSAPPQSPLSYIASIFK